MSQRRQLLGAVLLGGLVAGCAVHEPKAAFRSTVWIGDRGISVPLPPPSFFEAPHQEVEVQGEVQHSGDLASGAEVHIVDTAGEGETIAPVDRDAAFTATLDLDLSDNCLEVWLVTPDGDEGDHSLYSTRIVSAEEIEVVEGCEE